MRDLAGFAGSADLGAILVIALGLLAFWATLFPDLRTAAAPHGIVSLELPWNAKRAWRIVASWEREGTLGAARRSLLLDLPFIALYLVALLAFDILIARAGLALGLFSDRAEQCVAAILVCAASLAAVLDLLENLGIRLMLGGRYWAARVTSIVSAGKWALLALASIVGLPLALPRVLPRQWATLKPRWSSRDRWVGCVLAIPTLVLGVWFWRQHAIDPLTAPALLLDRTFQVLTLVLIPASALFACAAARPALVYAITFIGAIRPPHDHRAVAFAVLTLLTAAGLVARYSRHIPDLRTRPTRRFRSPASRTRRPRGAFRRRGATAGNRSRTSSRP